MCGGTTVSEGSPTRHEGAPNRVDYSNNLPAHYRIIAVKGYAVPQVRRRPGCVRGDAPGQAKAYNGGVSGATGRAGSCDRWGERGRIMTKTRPITSYDVAAQAGVSQATVSVVLSGRQSSIRVSEATRQRVLAAAAALHYSPNSLAQAFRRQRSGIIGFVPRLERVTPEQSLPVMYLLGHHIARTAIAHRYHVLEAGAESEGMRTGEDSVAFMLSRRVDGVIFDRPYGADAVRHFVSRDVPVVQLIRPQTAVPTATITVDAAPGIDAALDHLVTQGHRRIAHIGHDNPHPAVRSRLDAFHAALARHRLAIPPGYIQLRAVSSIEDGVISSRHLLALPVPPTAIIATAEALAFGALRALYEARVHVPEEMSVIGYDDAFSVHLYPPLTSVAQPFREIAERSVGLILEQLNGGSGDAAEPTHVVLPTTLMIRESTGPPGT